MAEAGRRSGLDLLPPCRVCGDKASGLHYGVNSCEACKRFFRRSLKRKSEFKCTGHGSCRVDLPSRASCGACRYTKCVGVGMAWEAIKMGRTTSEKKSANIQEVQKLLCQVHLQPKLLFGQYSAEHLLDVVNNIMIAYKEYIPHTPSHFETVAKQQAEYIYQKRVQKELFGKMQPLQFDEHMAVLETTGVDLDGRLDFFNSLYPMFEECLRQIVKFARVLPGFKELGVDDKVALVKYRFTEVYLIWDSCSFNVEEGLWSLLWGQVWEYNLVRHFFRHNELMETVFRVLHCLKKLELTFEELVLLGCIAFMSSDKSGLQYPEKVEEVQLLLLASFHLLLQRSHASKLPDLILAKSISVLTELRNVANLSDVEVESSFRRWFGKVPIPPLLKEVWTS